MKVQCNGLYAQDALWQAIVTGLRQRCPHDLTPLKTIVELRSLLLRGSYRLVRTDRCAFLIACASLPNVGMPGQPMIDSAPGSHHLGNRPVLCLPEGSHRLGVRARHHP